MASFVNSGYLELKENRITLACSHMRKVESPTLEGDFTMKICFIIILRPLEGSILACDIMYEIYFIQMIQMKKKTYSMAGVHVRCYTFALSILVTK